MELSLTKRCSFETDQCRQASKNADSLSVERNEISFNLDRSEFKTDKLWFNYMITVVSTKELIYKKATKKSLKYYELRHWT